MATMSPISNTDRGIHENIQTVGIIPRRPMEDRLLSFLIYSFEVYWSGKFSDVSESTFSEAWTKVTLDV